MAVKRVFGQSQIMVIGTCRQNAPAVKDLQRIGIHDQTPLGLRDMQRQRRFARGGRPRDQHRPIRQDQRFIGFCGHVVVGFQTGVLVRDGEDSGFKLGPCVAEIEIRGPCDTVDSGARNITFSQEIAGQRNIGVIGLAVRP